MSTADDPIDQLYRGRLDAFVADRNALAKALKRPEIKGLEKPSAPAWAVNQLFWQDRAAFDCLVDASEALRAAHRDALAGQAPDLRAAEAAHRTALREALAAAQQHLRDADLPASPATIDAIRRTLESLPHPDAQGRLVQPLSPAGLEALAGLMLAPGPPRTSTAPSPSPAPAPSPGKAAEPSGAKAHGPAVVMPFPKRTRPDADAVQAAREREAQARAAREREAQAREERQRAADAAVRDAAKAYERAQAAVSEAEAVLSERRATRDAAAAAYEKAKRAARDVV